MNSAARKPVEAMTNREAVAELRRVARACVICGDPTVGLQCSACRSGEKREPAPESRAVGSLGADPALALVTEAQAQEEVRNALLAVGWKVYRVGQRDARGTQDPGVSDLLCFRERVVFCEMKRPVGGEQSAEQRQFQADVEAAGGEYRIARGVDDVRDMTTEEQ